MEWPVSLETIFFFFSKMNSIFRSPAEWLMKKKIITQRRHLNYHKAARLFTDAYNTSGFSVACQHKNPNLLGPVLNSHNVKNLKIRLFLVISLVHCQIQSSATITFEQNVCRDAAKCCQSVPQSQVVLSNV